jgi:hypothetical protein
MNVNDFISEIAIELVWERSELSKYVQRKYREYLSSSVDETLIALDACDTQFTDALKILLDAMESESRVEFVTAPVFASLTIMPESLYERGKRAFILRNLLQLTGAGSQSHRTTNHFGETTAPAGAQTELSASLVKTQGRGASYRILFDGELPIPGIDRGGTMLAPVLDEELRVAILNKLTAADSVIQANQHLYTFTVLNTEIIVCRFEKEFPMIFSSGSFRLMPGLSLFCNSHLPSVSYHNLADSLVHEAIHAIIYRFETYGQRLVPKENENSGKVMSPWSGALLNPNSFAQACLVWYGLYHFWKQHETEDRASIQHCEKARSGFLSASFVEICRNISPILSVGVGRQLEALADAVRH